MPKFLLAIFLIVIGYKLVDEVPAFYKIKTPKQTCCNLEIEEMEKGKVGNSESDSEIPSHINNYTYLPEQLKSTTGLVFYYIFKTSSGFTNPAYTPPIFI